MINIEYFQVGNEKYIRIYNTDKCNDELRNICIKCDNGDLVLRDNNNNMYDIENKDDSIINIFDIVNKQDIYIISNSNSNNKDIKYNNYTDIDKDIW